MHRQLRKWRRGSALIEFILVGIPFLFLWISIEEISRGMFPYHTLQFASKMAASYASEHGATCSSGTNTCSTTVGNVVTVFKNDATTRR